MQRAVTIFVLITLVALAGFGFVAMGHSGSHTEGGNLLGCIASNAQGSVCPDGSNPLLYALFHLNALQTFLLGVVPLPVAALILLTLAGMLSVGLLSLLLLPDSRIVFAFAGHGSFVQTTAIPFRERLTAWLALQEKRDPALSL